MEHISKPKVIQELPKLIFVHIPRTGGGTFREILKNIYYNKTYIGVDIPKNYKDYDLIMGHFSYRQYNHNPLITWVRDPVNRIISQYYWWKINSQYREFIIPNISVTIGPKVNIYGFSKIVNNLMFRFLGDDLSKFKFIGLYEEYNLSLKLFKQITKLSIPENFEYRNKGIGKKEVSNEIQEILTYYNSKDIKLYNEAKTIFYSNLERYNLV